MPDDVSLLSLYAEAGDQAAFTALVRRHVDAVYSMALRRAGGDAHLAGDIAQQVFVALARDARRVAAHPVLAGWLYTTTRNIAANAVRSERRRKLREQEAGAMEHALSKGAAEADWNQVAPVLEEAMDELGDAERQAVWLRFYDRRSLREVGQLLRLTEDAARKRVDRALDKLQLALRRRGVVSSASALAVVLTHGAVGAAPVDLVTSVTGAALTMTGGAAGAGGVGQTVFFMSKLKWTLAGLMVAGGLALGMAEGRVNRALRVETAALRSDDLAQLRRENSRLRTEATQFAPSMPEADELLKVRQRIATLKARPPGVVEAEIRAPRNVGRATPAAAFETFAWGVMQHDLDLVTSFVTLADDSPENRETFLSNFTPAVRARYGTVERLCAAAFFGAAVHPVPDPFVALQVWQVEEQTGGDVRLHLWFRSASGKESAGNDTYRLRTDGWAGKPVSILKPAILQLVRERIDPNTGDFVPPRVRPQP